MPTGRDMLAGGLVLGIIPLLMAGAVPDGLRAKCARRDFSTEGSIS
jgi:hypothetical protein